VIIGGKPETELGRVPTVAKSYLGSRFLCERAARIHALAGWVAGFSEFMSVACNRAAVEAAIWFQDAWCVEQVRNGEYAPGLILTRDANEGQRERSADLATEILSGELDEETIATAARAIRAAGVRNTGMPEAQILAEATNLDSIGPLWLWGQIARCSAEDRSAGSLIAVWERQTEYGYWAKRIAETLRFERSRELARQRCAAIDEFMTALRRQIDGSDRHVAPGGQT
jgi:hypothetical protein